MLARHRTTSDGAVGVGAGGHIGAGSGLAATCAHGRALRRVSIHGHLGAGRHSVLGSLHFALQAC